MSLRGPIGFVNAERFVPSKEPPLWIWYEDMVRGCNATFATLYDRLGLFKEMPPDLCSTTEFRNETLVRYMYLLDELMRYPKLAPMNNSFAFDMAVNTTAIYEESKRETINISEVMLGYWR